jgi:hypothetical protein
MKLLPWLTLNYEMTAYMFFCLIDLNYYAEHLSPTFSHLILDLIVARLAFGISISSIIQLYWLTPPCFSSLYMSSCSLAVTTSRFAMAVNVLPHVLLCFVFAILHVNILHVKPSFVPKFVKE